MHRKINSRKTLIAGGFLIALLVLTVSVVSAAGFERGPVITLDGVDYYMAGPPDGPNGASSRRGVGCRDRGLRGRSCSGVRAGYVARLPPHRRRS